MDLFSKQTWDNYDPDNLIGQRLKLIRKLIPPDVKSILDAGCGNGYVTNPLERDYDIVGLDFSEAALEHVKTPKVLSSVTAMPFGDGSFDLCMCNEVLEHLSSSELGEAVSELKRCARKYILVSVPNREQLDVALIKCADCDTVYHAYGHRQSFDLQRLDKLFGLPRLSWHVLGPRQSRSHLPLLHLRQQIHDQWFTMGEKNLCPACGGTGSHQRTNAATKLINFLNRWTTLPRCYWLMVLYANPAGTAEEVPAPF
jgi:SAM-dependent methyltransferase